MPASTPRTRLIFQNVNAYVGPAGSSGTTATGAMNQSGTAPSNQGSNLILELANVTSATLNVGINRQDVNIFGVLNRVDQIIMAPANISLDLGWNATDGYNESVLGFNAKGGSFLSGILTKQSDSKNYFLSISQQGVDDDGVTNPTQRDVYAVGNGFISNYSFNMSVGQIATTSISVDGMNVVPYGSATGNQTPAIDPTNGTRISAWNFWLPVGQTIAGSNNVYALKPGDITLQFPTNAGFLSPLSGQNQLNVQSVSLSVPISREILNRLGSPFGYSREIQFPVNCSLQIRALATEVNTALSYDTLLCNDVPYDMKTILRQPSCNGTGQQALVIGFNEAKVTSWSEGITVGGDATVDVSLSAQIAGPFSLEGITFSGFGAFQV